MIARIAVALATLVLGAVQSDTARAQQDFFAGKIITMAAVSIAESAARAVQTTRGDTSVTDQRRTALTPTLVGTWRKITTSACANKYPDRISFAVETYLGNRGSGQAFVWWDAGIYRLEDESTLVLGTATDELVTYKISLSTDKFDVTDPEGCRFSYQREKPAQ